MAKERANLDRLICELNIQDYVSLLGLRDDVMSIMKECDIYVSPSQFEGLSIAMIEAMAMFNANCSF